MAGSDNRASAITLVCCTYNREDALRATVPSKLGIVGISRILFVVDGSTDGSIEYLRSVEASDSRVSVVVRGHAGIQQARNAAVALVNTAWVLMIDDDDLCPPDFAEKLMGAADRARADIVGAPWLNATSKPVQIIVDERRARVSQTYSLRSHVSEFTSAEVDTPFLTSSILVRTELARSFDYDSVFGGNSWREETDLFLRIYEGGARFVRSSDTYSWNEKRFGGGHPRSRLWYEWWVLVNEARFLRRHAKTLKGIEERWLSWPLELVRTMYPRVTEAITGKTRLLAQRVVP